jgi:Ca2+-binding EF-hand superfamily protein
MEFLRDFDHCNQQVISREDFKRGLSVCRFDLTENEIETLMEV